MDGISNLRNTHSDELSNTGTDLQRLIKQAEQYITEAKSTSTRRGYKRDWQQYCYWCSSHNIDPLPARYETIVLYITHLANEHRVSTISRSMTAISQAHKLSGFPSPCAAPIVSEALKGIKKKLGVNQKRAKPLVWVDLKKVIDQTPPTFLGRRDGALLLLGWAGALRRSEVVAIDYEDIEFRPEGMAITIRRSKTDQEGEGYVLGIPLAKEERYCPTTRIRHWIDLARITSGPLFFAIGSAGGKWFYVNTQEHHRLSDRMVNEIVKKYVSLAGISPAGYSGHSLRAGFVSEAASKQTPEYSIQLHTRHRSTKILRGYIRNSSIFADNPLSILI